MLPYLEPCLSKRRMILSVLEFHDVDLSVLMKLQRRGLCKLEYAGEQSTELIKSFESKDSDLKKGPQLQVQKKDSS